MQHRSSIKSYTLGRLEEIRRRSLRHPEKFVFYARGIDGLELKQINIYTERAEDELRRVGLPMLDPLKEVPRIPEGGDTPVSPAYIVENDLELMAKASAILMDISLPARSYVGCSCEMVYARLIGIPVVAFVGQSGNENRIWLQYHVENIFTELSEAVDAVAVLLRSERS